MATGRKQHNEKKFRVLISGGGIAGLTLANALQHAGIDYLLLEARSEIAPQLGASIGLGPNGSRILDQLGCYDEIMTLTQPIEYTGSHYGNTGDYVRPKTDAFQLVQARANYCMCFLDRQAVLRVLAEHIMDKKKILLNKKIVKADQHAHGVKVTCHDGTSYDGDILVGADGTYSMVRREMWRVADIESPGEISESEKNNMSAEYKCVFGISTPIPELTPRAFDVTFKKDVSPIVITSKNGRVYWFLIARMPQVFKAGSIPRFSKEEAQAFVREHLDVPLMPGAKVTVRDLWEKQETYTMVALEEAYYEHWAYGRFALVGDSVHKMTPNMGSGGNSAIESAAALVNSLVETLDQSQDTTLSLEEIQRALCKYQETRKVRASRTVKASNFVTRVHAMKGYLHRIAAFHILPNAGDLLVDLAAENWIGSVKLDYMPIPLRSLGGTMPFNPQQGMGNNENLLFRALVASPLLIPPGLHLLSSSIPTVVPWQMLLHNSFDTLSLDLRVADFATLYGIVLVEAARRANLMTPLAVPFFFGMGCQLTSAEMFMPIYYFTYASLVPISRFKASDLRLTDMSYTRSILPVILACYHLPCLLSTLSRTGTVQNAATWAFRLSPLLISLGQWVCSKTIFPSTVQQDRLTNVQRDMTTIQYSVGSLALLSSVSWIHTLRRALPFLIGMLDRSDIAPSAALMDLVAHLSQNSHAWFSGASLLWITYLYNDLKRAGMIRHYWLTILSGLTISTLSIGPGATVAMAWLYRERILATKRHKGAII